MTVHIEVLGFFSVRGFTLAASASTLYDSDFLFSNIMCNMLKRQLCNAAFLHSFPLRTDSIYTFLVLFLQIPGKDPFNGFYVYLSMYFGILFYRLSTSGYLILQPQALLLSHRGRVVL